MSSRTIGGKKPISSKARPAPLAEPDFFMNKAALTTEIINEIKEKDLDHRWIDYKKYVSEGNVHARGWTVYKRENKGGTDEFLLGNSPDGIIRRGSMVLAVRPLSYTARHKAYLEEKNNRYKRFNETKSDEFRQKARELGSDVDDDYDGDDE